MKKNRLKAASLRTLLILAIITITTISVGGFYFAQNWLKQAAEEYNKTATTSTTSGTNTISIKKLQEGIVQYQPAADKANSIFASSQDYQTKTISDLKKYASISGITISDYSFEKTDSNTSTGDAQTSGSGQTSITITITNPVKFSSLMKFVKGVETNSPKMQLSGIDISKSNNSKDLVVVKPLTIKVYIK